MNTRTLFKAVCAVVTVFIASCSPLDYGYVGDDNQSGQTQTPEPEPDPTPEPEPEPEPLFVPFISINIENGKNVESKDEYQNMTLTIKKDDDTLLSASGRIKGRGNATWGYEKKPYKIKFDEKQEVLGFAV